MTRVIFKYSMRFQGNECTLQLPKGAEILTIDYQSHQPQLWAEVNTEEEKTEERTFVVYGTGSPMNSAVTNQYIVTRQQGQYVWHFYEMKD